MTTAQQREICNKTNALVQEKISLRDFEAWFVPAVWNIHRSNDPDAQALADTIDLNIFEYTSGLLTQDELRQELAAAIRPFETQAVSHPATRVAVQSSSNEPDPGTPGNSGQPPRKPMSPALLSPFGFGSTQAAGAR